MPDVSPAAPRGHAPSRPRSCDVVVVGAGPSGASCAYWLAEAGLDVVVLEKKHFPREKTCGDGVTPRAVRQLEAMGLADEIASHHRFIGLRAIAFGRELDLEWPRHDDFPDAGYVITRAELDALVAGRAEKAGAELRQGTEAIAVVGERPGPARGVVVQDHDRDLIEEIHAKVVVVADGANSRIGRALGAARDRDVPLGMAIRSYHSSPRADEPFIESHLDIRDREGNAVPGYGWIFPLGDGRVNVGLGILASDDRLKGINTTKLLETFIDFAPSSWCLSAESALCAPTGGRLPMGFAVGPRVGPDYLLIGDAGGSINPFNGEGIAYGYETGRLAAEVITGALAAGDLGVLASYEERLEARYGRYYRVAAAFMALMMRPALLRRFISWGMHSKTFMASVLRIMSNMLREGTVAAPELAYRVAARLLDRGGTARLPANGSTLPR
ncbi:MAG TPA: NAD(P)/FAD-dependent oxidoreductase [Acidimicrobiales bacterium]|nr:NAD(P)/FAD-dependent oxidoreductase [Acidimicrobiales bacterium]